MAATTNIRAKMPARRQFHHESIEVRRNDLLTATLDAVAELGLKRATVREIAKRANVTPGLIRHYFENKDLMFQVAYRQVMDRLFESTKLAADQLQGSARDRLRCYILACFDKPVSEPRTLTLWATFVAQISVDPALAAIHNERYAASRSWIEARIAQARSEAGQPVSAAEARKMSIAVNGLMDGLWIEATLAAPLFAESELVNTALDSIERITGITLVQA